MADPCQNKGLGRGKMRREGRDEPKWPAPARIRGGEGKMRRKEGRDGPKWPACQNKG